MAVRSCMALATVASGFYFPDTLVEVPNQPKSPADLIDIETPTASWSILDAHMGELAATPEFTKHMNVFKGVHATRDMSVVLRKETGLTLSGEDWFRCAQDPDCFEVWTTASALMNNTIRITDVVGSWNMSETGVGNACHVNIARDHAMCHIPSDPYKHGISWMALGVPVDTPMQKALPVALRCHDMCPTSDVSQCHVLAGNEFMAAQTVNIHFYTQGEKDSALTAVVDHPSIHIDKLHYPSPYHTYLTDTCQGYKGSQMSGYMPCYSPNIIVHTPSRRCLGVADNSNGAPLEVNHCTQGNLNQQWLFDSNAQSLTLASGKCVDAPGGNINAAQLLELWECNGLPQQQYGLDVDAITTYEKMQASPLLATSEGDGGSIFSSVSSDASLCLDVWDGGVGPRRTDPSRWNGNPVWLWDCNGDNNQMFKWFSASTTQHPR